MLTAFHAKCRGSCHRRRRRRRRHHHHRHHHRLQSDERSRLNSQTRRTNMYSQHMENADVPPVLVRAHIFTLLTLFRRRRGPRDEHEKPFSASNTAMTSVGAVTAVNKEPISRRYSSPRIEFRRCIGFYEEIQFHGELFRVFNLDMRVFGLDISNS